MEIKERTARKKLDNGMKEAEKLTKNMSDTYREGTVVRIQGVPGHAANHSNATTSTSATARSTSSNANGGRTTSAEGPQGGDAREEAEAIKED
jgi:hypothetical protein